MDFYLREKLNELISIFNDVEESISELKNIFYLIFFF
jgi:hypothetical protein